MNRPQRPAFRRNLLMPWKDARHSQKAVRRQFGKWNPKARKGRGRFLAECRAKAAANRCTSGSQLAGAAGQESGARART